LQVCRKADHRYLASATVNGQSATFEVDTGSPETHVFAASKLGQSLAQRAGRVEHRGAVGAEYDARLVTGVDAKIGDVHRTVDVLLIPGEGPAGCLFDGMLGMDVLGNCRLALDSGGGVGRCRH
jgi:predicted aspartyl protease